MNEQNNFNNQDNNNQDEFLYKKVMLNKKNSRAWSVASLAVSIVSLLCCCFVDWLGMILSAAAIVFALISRKNIGYFDGFSLAGLIVGIFGIVFGIASIIMTYLMKNNDYFKELLKEYEEFLNQNGGGIDPGTDPGVTPDVPSEPSTPTTPGGPAA